MVICLDQQHINRPHKPHDQGAALLRPGFTPLTEAFLVSMYILAAREHLERDGHTVFTGFFGSYRSRHALVNRLDPDLYLACHFNSGGGEYSLTKVQPHSRDETLSLAACLSDAVRSRLALKKAMVKRFTFRMHDGDHGAYFRYERGYITLKHIKRPMAILYEPAFLRDPMLRLASATRDDIIALSDHIGMAIAEGIRTWSKSKLPCGHVEGFTDSA